MLWRARIGCLLFAAPVLWAQRDPLFRDEILPVFEKSCVGCHGPKQKMAGLDLSTFAGMMAGGSSGPVIAPGKPDRSLLWKMLETGKMPMGGKMSAPQKQLIKAYIEHGRFPKEDVDAAQLAREKLRISDKARNWWSFRKPVKPAVPAFDGSPIDAFISAKLSEKGWRIQPEADKRTLLRRVFLGLTGLPPTPAELHAFLADSSPGAYERVVDRLLASPAYGEHWARHWLDVAGYSDSRGDAGDTLRETAWKYRDYVIRAFNTNKPVDRFLLEQMAGDQLVNYQPGTRPTAEQREALTATGFLRTTADITDNQTIYQVDKYFDAMNKAMETSISAITGLTIGCARCHDHKFDPILQKDYYKLMAVYQPVWDPENWLAANLAFGPWPSRMVLDIDPEKREAWIKDVTSSEAKTLRRLQDLLDASYERFRAELKLRGDIPVERRLELRRIIEADPDLVVDRTPDPNAISTLELEKRFPELAAWKQDIATRRANRRKKQSAIDPNYIEAAWDVSRTPSPTYVLMRGNYLSPGVQVKPGIPAVFDNPGQPYAFPEPKPEWHHTGRRLALAQWLVSRDNPLTARVFVNRIWQFHFGEGIVRSVGDFGFQGTAPSHPELLEYLAVTFQEQGWDLKRLTKEIVMSRAYRQSSKEIAECLEQDPSSKLLWRKPPLRLEAETIRDSMLMVSGLLSKDTFGPPVPLRRGADGQWLEDEKGANRRSIYLAQVRTRPVAFLHTFDAPSMTADNQVQRFRSALPSQALAILNGPLTMRASKAFAGQLWEQSQGNAAEAFARAFEAAYARPPNERERAIAAQAMAADSDPKEGLRLFLQALLGANDFLYSF